MLTFLAINDIELEYDDELLQLVEDVAKSKSSVEEEHERICNWIKKHAA